MEAENLHQVILILMESILVYINVYSSVPRRYFLEKGLPVLTAV